MSFRKWLNQAPKEDFGTKPEAEKKPTRKNYWELEVERHEEAYKAASNFREKSDAAMKDFVCTEPAFKIVQVPAGHYEIHRSEIISAADYYGQFSMGGASIYEKANPAPKVSYKAVSNPDAPIVTREYGGYRGITSDRTTGYKPMLFNVFEDAEAYLMRMLKKDVAVAEYDFPPLKKRPVKRATGETK